MWCPTYRAGVRGGDPPLSGLRRGPGERLPDETLEYIPETWKLAMEYTDEIAASLAEGLLAENDIPCKLENSTFHAEPVAVSQSFSRVRVWVEEENWPQPRRSWPKWTTTHSVRSAARR